MKVSGKHFKKGMTDNTIIISKEFVEIHSSEGEIGIFRKEKNLLDNSDEEKIKFNLNAKDFSLLSKFQELEIEMINDTVIFSASNSKFKIQNYEKVLPKPSTEGAKLISADLSIIKKAANYNDAQKKEYAGILIYPSCIVGTSGNIFYRNKVETGCDLIHVPVGFLKLLNDETYKLQTTGKSLFALGNGEIIYTALYEQKVDKLDSYNPKFNAKIKCDIKQVIEHFEIISNFSKRMLLTIKNDEMILSSYAEEGEHKEYSARITLDECDIAEYCKCFDVQLLKKMLSSFDTKTIELSDVSSMIKNKNEVSIVSTYAYADHIDIKKKEIE